MKARHLLASLAVALVLVVAAFTIGAGVGAHRAPRKAACESRNHSHDARLEASRSEATKPTPLAARPTPLKPGELAETLRALAIKYADQLEPWGTISPEAALTDLQYSRRPEVVRGPGGEILEVTTKSLESSADNTFIELFEPPVPGSRHALDQIDLVLERVAKGDAVKGQDELMNFIGEPVEGEGKQANFLESARTRAALALRDVTPLAEATLSRIEKLLESERDPLLRSALASTLSSAGRATTVDQWLNQERDPRALIGILTDWNRHMTSKVMVTERDGAFVNNPVQMGLVSTISSLVEDESRAVEVRAAAAKALGYRVHEPGAFATLERTLLATATAEALKVSVVRAFANATTNQRAEQLLWASVQDAVASDDLKRAAIQSLHNFKRAEVAETMARITIQGDLRNRADVAAGLIGRVHQLSQTTREALVAQHARETDPAVKQYLSLALGIGAENRDK